MLPVGVSQQGHVEDYGTKPKAVFVYFKSENQQILWPYKQEFLGMSN